MLETAQTMIKRAGTRLGLTDKEVNQLLTADQEHQFEIKMDDGQRLPAYRVQHNNRRGPYKGGLRFHPEVDIDEVRALATLMSLKTAAAGLPLGGGKGGVVVDPRRLDNRQLEELSRKYVRALHEHIGPDRDVPAPDVNTNAEIIDWMVDEYQKLSGDTSRASFTGKSIKNGGSLGRDAATGRGGVIVLAELLKDRSQAGQPLTMAIQGFGNVGSFFATEAATAQPQWQLVAVSDSATALYDPSGLPAKELAKFKTGGGRFADYQKDGIKQLTNDELLALKVDILVLAALGDAVTGQNMKNIKAEYVVEMANGPVDQTAHDYLTGRGVTILPDIVANAGGVVVSYLEWLQNKRNEHWSKAEVNHRLNDYLTKATADMLEIARKEQINSLTEAAFMLALRRLTSPD